MAESSVREFVTTISWPFSQSISETENLFDYIEEKFDKKIYNVNVPFIWQGKIWEHI